MGNPGRHEKANNVARQDSLQVVALCGGLVNVVEQCVETGKEIIVVRVVKASTVGQNGRQER